MCRGAASYRLGKLEFLEKSEAEGADVGGWERPPRELSTVDVSSVQEEVS